MAKRIEHIVGLHNLFPTKIERIDGVDEIYYDLSVSLDYNQSVTENTVLFIDADSEDVNKYIHINSTFKRIRPGDNYIITEGKVYSNNFSIEGQYIPSYVKGPKGDPGPQGPQGEQGPQGPTGVYTGGTNIDITDNVISAKGYVFNETKNSFAECESTASGTSSHAEGNGVEAVGDASHAEGWYGIGSSNNPTYTVHPDESDNTKYIIVSDYEGTDGGEDGIFYLKYGMIFLYSDEYYYVTEVFYEDGSNTKPIAFKLNKIIDRQDTEDFDITLILGKSIGKASHIEGCNTVAYGDYSHSEGTETSAIGERSHAEGSGSISIGSYSHTEGNNTTTIGYASHAEGSGSHAIGIASHAEGSGSYAVGMGSHVEGRSTNASNNYTHAEGDSTTAIGNASHAEGISTKTGSSGAHAEGSNTVANGSSSHAEGSGSHANGEASHAEGSGSYALGSYSHAEGRSTSANSNYTHTEGDHTAANGEASHAEGYLSLANGIYSHTEGSSTTADGASSHAEGISTSANVEASHTEGKSTTAHGLASHAEGESTTTHGQASHAEGNTTKTEGYASHSEGEYTTSIGEASHAEGNGTKTIGFASHSEGISTTSEGQASHTEGNGTKSIGVSSHAEGYLTITNGSSSHAEGYKTIAEGQASHAEGYETKSIGISSHTEGQNTIASGDYSHAEGSTTTALGEASHAEGNNTTTEGEDSHAEGQYTKTVGEASHAEGRNSEAIGYYSHTEGDSSHALGQASHAEGNNTTAEGQSSHTEGELTKAVGTASHAEGYYTISANEAEHSEGKFNITNIGTISSIGIGTSDTERKNAFEVMTDGNIYVNGLGDYDGTNAVNPNSEGKTAKTLQNLLLNKGYFFDDIKNSFTEGYNELEFIDSGIDAEIVTSSEDDTPTNEFETTKSDLTIGDTISINGNIYIIVEKREENSSYIYTVDNGPIENGGKIYVLKFGAIGEHSHSEGYETTAEGENSHAEGENSHAEGRSSHAEGFSTATGAYSHSEGEETISEGECSHTEGFNNAAIGGFSHAEGNSTTAQGDASHTEGLRTIATNVAEHAEGKYNVSNIGTISSIGVGVITDDGTIVRKNALEVMDNGDVYIYGIGDYDGTNITTTNIKGERLPASIQEVLPKYNKEKRSICFQYNEADNSLNEAQSDYSFVIGYNNKAIREETTETGLTLQAANTFVGGMDNRAYHSNSIVFGEGLYTQFGNTFVLGKYNGTVSNQDGWGDTVLGIVGDGYKDSNGNETRRNVLLLQGGGDPALHCRGGFKNDASWINDFGEYFEWLDGNPDNEDRIGYMVQLNGDKIELATSLKKCIGVISGTTGFVGGVCAIEWHNKFLHDKWGREIIGEDGNPILNPDYDPDLEYIPREQRKEWDVVGLVGQVITRQDGTLEVGGYAGCSKGIATKSTTGFRVLKIIDNETALLLVK